MNEEKAKWLDRVCNLEKSRNCDGVARYAMHGDGASKGANFYLVPLATARVLYGAFLDYSSVIDHRLNFLIRDLELAVYWAQPPNVRKVIRRGVSKNCNWECQNEGSAKGQLNKPPGLLPPSTWEAECRNCRIRDTMKRN